MFLINPYIYGAPISYLVDDYSPVVAYSFDQISSTATNVVRLRRDSDSAESNFTALDLTDGTALAWAPSQYARVVKWINQGTGASTYDLTQTTANQQPIIIDNNNTFITINGKPSMLFQGAAFPRFLDVSSSPFGQVSNSFFAMSSSRVTETVGCVLGLSNSSNQSIRIFKDSTVATGTGNMVITNTTPATYFAGLSTARTTVNVLTLLSSFVDASKGMSAFDNGATGGTDTFTGTWTNNAITIGQQPSGATNLDGHISEVIGFATDESANRSAIETNINDRFSIY